MRRSSLTAALGATLLIALVAGVDVRAQGGQGRGGPAQMPKNLQVLPKDWTVPQVQGFMRTFTAGLGVQCGHCHVGTPQDRALDDKPEKKTARKMIAMVLAINDQYLKDVGEPAAAPAAPAAAPAAGQGPGGQGASPLPNLKVTCYTCHRGTTKPLTVAPAGGGLAGSTR